MRRLRKLVLVAVIGTSSTSFAGQPSPQIHEVITCKMWSAQNDYTILPEVRATAPKTLAFRYNLTASRSRKDRFDAEESTYEVFDPNHLFQGKESNPIRKVPDGGQYFAGAGLASSGGLFTIFNAKGQLNESGEMSATLGGGSLSKKNPVPDWRYAGLCRAFADGEADKAFTDVKALGETWGAK